MAPLESQEQKPLIQEHNVRKRNFTFVISALLIVAFVLLLKPSSYPQSSSKNTATPAYEYPILFYSQGTSKAAVLYDEPSLYGRVIVFDDLTNKGRYLMIDDAVQNSWWQSDQFVVPPRNAQLLTQFFGEGRKDLAFIGLGRGIFLNQLAGSSASVDVVEINPKIVRVAKKYFGLPQDLDYRIFSDDGRHFLATREKQYDSIIIDLCDILESNAHLFTKEFFALARKQLKHDDGLLIFSLNMVKDEAGVALAHSVVRTMEESFPYTYVVDGNNFFDNTSKHFGALGIVVFLASAEPIGDTRLEQLNLQQLAAIGEGEVITDNDTAAIVREHLPILAQLRQQFVDDYGLRLFLEQ